MIKTLAIDDFCPSSDQTIWDVRPPDSYQQGHIEHAQNQPLDTLDKTLLDATTGDIYVLCGGGTKAAKACELLERLDPTRTYVHLTGGTRGAMAKGMTIIKNI
ncbi:MAG: rhodanese-like domain-containing protein [Moraxella sp.]|nr:rhodanese-like domain-containing protein [Moraxella sp.]